MVVKLGININSQEKIFTNIKFPLGSHKLLHKFELKNENSQLKKCFNPCHEMYD